MNIEFIVNLILHYFYIIFIKLSRLFRSILLLLLLLDKMSGESSRKLVVGPQVDTILCDIEGTTTAISFVKVISR